MKNQIIIFPLLVASTLRACLNLAFESTVSKFCSEQPVPYPQGREGRRREHARSYVTDAQPPAPYTQCRGSAEQNLPPVGRSVKFKQASLSIKYLKKYALLIALFLFMQPGYLLSQDARSRLDQKLPEIASYIEHEMKARKIPGLVLGIFDENTMLAARAYGLADVQNQAPVRIETTFELASITKQFTASAILILQQDGKLKVADKLCAYLDECPDEWSAITIEQCLTHTSGLPGLWKNGQANYVEMFSGVNKMPSWVVALGLFNWSKKFQFDAMKTDTLNNLPGEVFNYSDVGYFLLGIVIDNLSGSYREFLEDRIFKPAGMTATYVQDMTTVHPFEARGYTLRDGELVNINRFVEMEIPSSYGVFSNMVDLQKWDAVLNTNEILTNDSKRLLWANHTLNTGKRPPYGYGYGWFVKTHNGKKIVRHDGVTGNDYLKLVDDKLSIVTLTNLGIGSFDRVNYQGMTDKVAEILGYQTRLEGN